MVPEILSSKGKSHNSASQAYQAVGLKSRLIQGFESSLFTYISMLKKFGHFLMNSSRDQGRAEDFQIGVALRISAPEGREKFLSATPIFGLLGVALRIRCGAKKNLVWR